MCTGTPIAIGLAADSEFEILNILNLAMDHHPVGPLVELHASESERQSRSATAQFELKMPITNYSVYVVQYTVVLLL